MSNGNPSGPVSEATLEETGFSRTMSLIHGKHELTVPHTLPICGESPFNEPPHCIAAMTFKALFATLKELAADRFVQWKECPQEPRKVE